MNAVNTSREVQKETLPQFHFLYQTDILEKSEDRVMRYLALEKGLVLGNAHHGKVTLELITADNQLISVTTTIWALSDSHVTLKGGINIPITSIYSVSF